MEGDFDLGANSQLQAAINEVVINYADEHESSKIYRQLPQSLNYT